MFVSEQLELGRRWHDSIWALGLFSVAKMAISWSKCHKGCPYNGLAGGGSEESPMQVDALHTEGWKCEPVPPSAIVVRQSPGMDSCLRRNDDVWSGNDGCGGIAAYFCINVLT